MTQLYAGILIMHLHPQSRCEDRLFEQEWRVGQHRSDSWYSSCSSATLGSDICSSLHQLPSYCFITTLPHPSEHWIHLLEMTYLWHTVLYIHTEHIFPYLTFGFFFSDAKTTGLPLSFRSNRLVTQKLKEMDMRKTALLKLGHIETVNGELISAFI